MFMATEMADGPAVAALAGVAAVDTLVAAAGGDGLTERKSMPARGAASLASRMNWARFGWSGTATRSVSSWLRRSVAPCWRSWRRASRSRRSPVLYWAGTGMALALFFLWRAGPPRARGP